MKQKPNEINDKERQSLFVVIASRLTTADYSDDTYYHYTYDAVGSRLTQQTSSTSISYTFDEADPKGFPVCLRFTFSWILCYY